MGCSFSSSLSQCGATTEYANATTIPLLNCKNDVSFYLRSTGASGACGRNISAQITDVELILIRDGLFIFPQRRYQQHDNLPSALRKQLTVNWPGSKAATCRYPSHQKRRGRTVWNGKLQSITKQVSEDN